MKKILISILLLSGLVGVGFASWAIGTSGQFAPTEQKVESEVGEDATFLPNDTPTTQK